VVRGTAEAVIPILSTCSPDGAANAKREPAATANEAAAKPVTTERRFGVRLADVDELLVLDAIASLLEMGFSSFFQTIV